MNRRGFFAALAAAFAAARSWKQPGVCPSCGRADCRHPNSKTCRIDQQYRRGRITRYGYDFYFEDERVYVTEIWPRENPVFLFVEQAEPWPWQRQVINADGPSSEISTRIPHIAGWSYFRSAAAPRFPSFQKKS